MPGQRGPVPASGWEGREQRGGPSYCGPPGQSPGVGKQRAKRRPLLSSLTPRPEPKVQVPQAQSLDSSCLGVGFYTTDFIAFLYNSGLSELERALEITSTTLLTFTDR